MMSMTSSREALAKFRRTPTGVPCGACCCAAAGAAGVGCAAGGACARTPVTVMASAATTSAIRFGRGHAEVFMKLSRLCVRGGLTCEQRALVICQFRLALFGFDDAKRGGPLEPDFVSFVENLHARQGGGGCRRAIGGLRFHHAKRCFDEEPVLALLIGPRV